jgi:hypothetical protein
MRTPEATASACRASADRRDGYSEPWRHLLWRNRPADGPGRDDAVPQPYRTGAVQSELKTAIRIRPGNSREMRICRRIQTYKDSKLEEILASEEVGDEVDQAAGSLVEVDGKAGIRCSNTCTRPRAELLVRQLRDDKRGLDLTLHNAAAPS